MQIAGYHILELLSESEHTEAYLAHRASEKPVVLKCTKSGQHARMGERLLRNEFEMNGFLNAGRPSESLLEEAERLVLVREFVDGVSLRKWMAHPADLGRKLLMAERICVKLEELYRHRIIHRDFKPDNIIVLPDETDIRIIDFSYATRLNIKTHYLGSPERLEGTLAYLAPEQTGRMNRPVDYRCDLYALGILLYELFTGAVPFRSDNPLELLHSHLARPPQPPSALNPDLPAVLDRIVLKLLSKNPEDRYQSAVCLHDDLHECRIRWEQNGHVDDFSIARQDIALQFKPSSALYGRASEQAMLVDAFQQTAQGQKKLFLIGGFSGCGKTALVYNLQVPISTGNGVLISGKFEQYQRNVPYFAWKQALEKWVDHLLTEDAHYLALWRQRLQQSLGDLLGILVDLVPGLEKIIGRHETPFRLSALENQNRFNYVVRTFLKTVCTREHPLVLFLDDLQWADTPSLSLLRTVMSEPGLGHLLVICAYRDNETPDGHPFLRAVADLEREWAQQPENDPDAKLVHRLMLGDLNEQDIARLVTDSIPMGATQAQALAADVFAKTRGNAYFTHRLLESLYEEGAIRIESENGRTHWRYDAALAGNYGLSDNVVALLERKVERLSASTRELLRKAACLGLQFDLQTLSIVADQSPARSGADLREALEEELLIPLGLAGGSYLPESERAQEYKYQFAHDRVRQAVYAAIPEEEKQLLHLQTGMLLLKTLTPEQQEERIFELVNHLNEAGPAMQNRQLLAELNFSAGNRAKSAIAYAPAYEYFRKTLDLLPEKPWATQYGLWLSAINGCAESAALNGDYEIMDPLIEQIVEHAATPLDKVSALEIRISSLFFRQKIDESVKLGKEALAMLGARLPGKVGQMNVMLELVKTNIALSGKNPEQLLQMPPMRDPRVLAIAGIIMRLAPSVFFADPNLFLLLNLRLTRLNARFGTSPTAAYAYSTYAFIVSLALSQFRRGAAFSNLALDLLARHPNTPNTARTLFHIHFFVAHWTRHSIHTLEPLKNGYQLSMSNGEADFTAFLGNAYAQNALLNGVDLADMEQELRQQAKYAQGNNLLAATFNSIYLQFVQCLRGKVAKPEQLSGEHFDPTLQREEIPGLFTNQNYYQLQLSLIFGDFPAARHAADLALKGRDQIRPVPIGKHLHYLDVLISVHHKGNPNSTVRRIRKRVKTIQQHARNCPEEYAGKSKMAEACLAIVQNVHGQALALLQEAEFLLKKEGNLLDLGLAYLEIHRYHESRRQEELSRLYLEKAIQAFRRWGADAVVDHLTGALEGRHRKRASGARSQEQTQSGIDVYSLSKGAQVISSELDLMQLAGKMLTVMGENAGAGRGVLLLVLGDQLRVTAVMEPGREAKPLDQLLDMSAFKGASTAIVNYVRQSGENVVLEDALHHGQFTNDPYIRERDARSVLCMNLGYKGNTAGILYLENNLVPGAFTPQRLEVLNILGAQAAISLENARYYQDIQNLNRAYERFVPRQFLQQLGRESVLDVRQGDQSVQDMAVMFSDIWGFTALAESMSAPAVFALLNEVWSLLTPVIERNGGIVDKYIGDAVMALFPQNAEGALRAAVEMQASLKNFNDRRREQGLLTIQMGIGLNYGAMILGTVGSESRLDTTVIGDAVNVAARLESTTRQYGCHIVFNSELWTKIANRAAFHIRPIGSIELRGRAQPIALCEEFSNDEPGLRSQKTGANDIFTAFLAAFAASDVSAARQWLHEYRVLAPGDGVAAHYEGLMGR
ncbi:MAG: AAA family ATPase [Saprospiraceae bacterium]|nr:AAA family ATPase [Saprospiraceae bacterium]